MNVEKAREICFSLTPEQKEAVVYLVGRAIDEIMTKENSPGD